MSARNGAGVDILAACGAVTNPIGRDESRKAAVAVS